MRAVANIICLLSLFECSQHILIRSSRTFNNIQPSGTVSREGCATPGHVQCRGDPRRALEQAQGTPPQRKIGVTSKTPVGVISVVTLIRTDTTLDHSQKAEKVCCAGPASSTQGSCVMDQGAHYWQLHACKLPPEKLCCGRLHRSLLRLYRPQSAVSCSTL